MASFAWLCAWPQSRYSSTLQTVQRTQNAQNIEFKIDAKMQRELWYCIAGLSIREILPYKINLLDMTAVDSQHLIYEIV